MTSPIPTEGGWTYRPEYHLGNPAYSLFDPTRVRSAVGLIRADAIAICHAMNTAPALLEALTDLVIYHDVPDECQDQVVKPLLKPASSCASSAVLIIRAMTVGCRAVTRIVAS